MTVGLHDISIFVPTQVIANDTIIEERGRVDAKTGRYLSRAKDITGQIQFAFPRQNEDSVTMALEASKILFDRGHNPDYLRYLSVGTETGVDHSKPISAYVQGALQRAGYEIPDTLSSFQVQHACAGATIGMASVGGLLALGNDAHDSALVIASDIARYEPSTTAEITQGAGACAMLVGKNPRLLSFDLGTMGMCSNDVDDFFRPLGSIRAQVQGRYSMDCYNSTLRVAFKDHCNRAGIDPKDALDSTDLFVFHAPFKNMPIIAIEYLLREEFGKSPQEIADFIKEKHFEESLYPVSMIGNTYTASMYIVLAQAIENIVKRLGRDAVGKTIMIASYGSGNTMLVMRARIEAQAPTIVRNWELSKSIIRPARASFADYEAFAQETQTKAPGFKPTIEPQPGQNFVLNGIRSDGYRNYTSS